MRTITLSARTIGTLLGKSPWQKPWECFVEKITGKYSFSTSMAMQHGLKNEQKAIECYKIQTNNEVLTSNKIYNHPRYNYITGKIDGLVKKSNGKNAILEVKCPYVKIFPDPNIEEWEIKEFYWIQVQLYMEILNIDETHFVEYYVIDKKSMMRYQVITRDKNWWNKNICIIERLYNEIILYKEIGINKHPVYITIEDWENDLLTVDFKKIAII